MNATVTERLWHVTVLSNFVRGFDKYARAYSKVGIVESRFPENFFLLRADELGIGIAKADRLMKKLAIPGDRLIGMATKVPREALRDNLETGLGRYVESASIVLDAVADIGCLDSEPRLTEIKVEEAVAQSMRLQHRDLVPYDLLAPRSFSILPIAKGCQASCPFCFSEASASFEQEQARLDLARVQRFARVARIRGATRCVITGGGEPGLVRPELLEQLIEMGRAELGKVVLITNGHHLAKLRSNARETALRGYARAGLSVLAISRHHHDDSVSERLMNLPTDVAAIAGTWRAGRSDWPALQLRLICVLQRGGVDSLEALAAYLDWAARLGVEEVCFKELYVSTSLESVYHRHATNAWSHARQVSLSLVGQLAALHGLHVAERLPWGAPVFEGHWRGHTLRIAAYTEPSLFWERTHGLARSWNMMADGRCLVSLEDRSSELDLPTAP